MSNSCPRWRRSRPRPSWSVVAALALLGWAPTHQPLATQDVQIAPPEASPGPEHTLYFIMNQHAWTADRGAMDGIPATSLGELFDTNVAAFTPRRGPSAVKTLTSHEFNVIIGEPVEIHGGDLDALGVRHLFQPAPAALTTPDFIFSTEVSWGTANDFAGTDGLAGALDGTLFSLDRTWNGADLLVRPFLREELVLQALGQPHALEGGDIDIDAFVQDEAGNLFLSFRDDELVQGVLVEDDGVVALPAHHLGYNSHGNIIGLTPGSAVIVLHKVAVDALVDHAELTTDSGQGIHTLGDLQALAIDPGGGSFDPVEPIVGLPDGCPHLLFNGQRIGATVLSTRDDGTIAQLDGHRLGSPILNGSGLGLDGPSTTKSSHDLNALCVRPAVPAPLAVDVSSRTVDLDSEVPAFLLGNFQPGGWAWVLVSGLYPHNGFVTSPTLAPPGAHYPHLYLAPAMVEVGVPIDFHGRARLEIPIANPPGIGLWIVLQAFEVGSARLSPPAAVWCPP